MQGNKAGIRTELNKHTDIKRAHYVRVFLFSRSDKEDLHYEQERNQENLCP